MWVLRERLSFHKPGSRAKFRNVLLAKLPFQAEVVLCDGRDLILLEEVNPFEADPFSPDVVRFVSILSKAGDVRASLPIVFPSNEGWLMRVLASKGQFVFGVYRRHMRTITYLGQIDKLYGAPATTRNWITILAIVRILKRRRRLRGAAAIFLRAAAESVRLPRIGITFPCFPDSPRNFAPCSLCRRDVMSQWLEHIRHGSPLAPVKTQELKNSPSQLAPL
jgi:hypothetical protein